MHAQHGVASQDTKLSQAIVAASRHPIQTQICGVQIQTAGIFLVGCPACNQNFKHFFCTITCSPDQSLFTNVTSVQNAFDNNKTVVEAIDVFVADAYGKSFYDSCKVRRPPFTLPAACSLHKLNSRPSQLVLCIQ